MLSWEFLTGDIPTIAARRRAAGMGPAVVGTLLITGAATLMAVPLGMLGGDLPQRVRRERLARPDGAVPRRRHDRRAVDRDGPLHLHVWVLSFGYSGFAGALALACLMLPVVIRTTEEMLRLVPQDLRQSAYALGGRKAGTIIRVVLPAAAPGIVSGALLAVARAAGETAPLLFTIFTVERDEHRPVQRSEHRALDADLQERRAGVPRPAGPGLGRGARPSSSSCSCSRSSPA